jgi:hypothetical protein
VSFDCLPVAADANELTVLRAYDHDGDLVLVHIAPDTSGRFLLRAIRGIDDAAPQLGSAPWKPKFARLSLPSDNVRDAIQTIHTAMAARVTVEASMTSSGIHVAPIEMSSRRVAIEFYLKDKAGHLASQRASGYSSVPSPETISLEVAWEILATLVPSEFGNHDPEPSDRTLLGSTWLAQLDRLWWIDERLMKWAPSLGGPEVIARLVAKLDDSSERGRVLAVNGLAAITGWDVRHDQDGRPRPLGAVVDDYRRECTSK